MHHDYNNSRIEGTIGDGWVRKYSTSEVYSYEVYIQVINNACSVSWDSRETLMRHACGFPPLAQGGVDNNACT